MNKIAITGKPNLGLQKERTQVFKFEKLDECIHLVEIVDGKKEFVLSFNPFLDNGSLWMKDINSLVIEEGNDRLHLSTFEIREWKRKAELYDKLKDVIDALRGEE